MVITWKTYLIDFSSTKSTRVPNCLHFIPYLNLCISNQALKICFKMLKLSPKAFHYYKKMLEIGCSFKIFPYDWDPYSGRIFPTRKLAAHSFHQCVMLYVFWFSTIRLFQNNSKTPQEFPLFVKVSQPEIRSPKFGSRH